MDRDFNTAESTVKLTQIQLDSEIVTFIKKGIFKYQAGLKEKLLYLGFQGRNESLWIEISLISLKKKHTSSC